MNPRRVSIIASCRDTAVTYPAFLTRSPGGQTNGCAAHIPNRSLPAKPRHVERDPRVPSRNKLRALSKLRLGAVSRAAGPRFRQPALFISLGKCFEIARCGNVIVDPLP